MNVKLNKFQKDLFNHFLFVVHDNKLFPDDFDNCELLQKNVLNQFSKIKNIRSRNLVKCVQSAVCFLFEHENFKKYSGVNNQLAKTLSINHVTKMYLHYLRYDYAELNFLNKLRYRINI